MPGLLHGAEGVDHALRREDTAGQGRERPFAEQGHDLSKQPRGELGPTGQQLIGIDAKVADVVLEGAQADGGVLEEIALAELQEAAEGLEHRKAAAHGLAGKRVEHDINAFAVGRGEDVVGKGEAARIEDMIRAEQAHEIAFLIAACRGIHLRAEMLGELDGGNAHPARRAVDEHALAGLQVGQRF